MVPVDYEIGMKCSSLREHDLADAGALIKMKGYTDPEFLYQRCRKYGLDIDSSAVLSGFGAAYGNEWLADYLASGADWFLAAF